MTSTESACGHRELSLECECGQAAAAWWADIRRKIAESHGGDLQHKHQEEAVHGHQRAG